MLYYIVAFIVLLIIILVAVAVWGSSRFEKQFLNDVNAHLQQNNNQHDLFIEADLKKLPLPVQAYLRYTGAVNQPKVKNMRLVFEGRMRQKGKDWFPFRSVQYNFFDNPARLFFMKAKMFGITVPGYHRYQNATATMDIRLFGLFSIVKEAGPVMNKTETVTLFNDMCLMAPATLIDKRIEWTAVDSLTAKAKFTNGDNTIAATLFFNTKGQLINFVSDDRTALPEGKSYRFSTPVKNYQSVNGRMLPLYGEAVWHYPNGEFVYGEFNLKEVAYNTGSFPQDNQTLPTDHSPQQKTSYERKRNAVLLNPGGSSNPGGSPDPGGSMVNSLFRSF